MENNNVTYEDFQSAWKTMNLYAYYKRAQKLYLEPLAKNNYSHEAVYFNLLGNMQIAALRLINKQPLYFALLCEDVHKHCPTLYDEILRKARPHFKINENGLLDEETKNTATSELQQINVNAMNTVYKYQPDTPSHKKDKDIAMQALKDFIPNCYDMLSKQGELKITPKRS